MSAKLDELPTPIAANRVLDAREAAKFLSISVSHLRRLARRGHVPSPIQLSTRRVGWRVSALIAELTRRENEAAQQKQS